MEIHTAFILNDKIILVELRAIKHFTQLDTLNSVGCFVNINVRTSLNFAYERRIRKYRVYSKLAVETSEVQNTAEFSSFLSIKIVLQLVCSIRYSSELIREKFWLSCRAVMVLELTFWSMCGIEYLDTNAKNCMNSLMFIRTNVNVMDTFRDVLQFFSSNCNRKLSLSYSTFFFKIITQYETKLFQYSHA